MCRLTLSQPDVRFINKSPGCIYQKYSASVRYLTRKETSKEERCKINMKNNTNMSKLLNVQKILLVEGLLYYFEISISHPKALTSDSLQSILIQQHTQVSVCLQTLLLLSWQGVYFEVSRVMISLRDLIRVQFWRVIGATFPLPYFCPVRRPAVTARRRTISANKYSFKITSRACESRRRGFWNI